LPVSSSCLKISSICILNRVADNGSPCFTPIDISNFSVWFWFTLTLASVSRSVLVINLIYLLGTSYLFKHFIILSLKTESNAWV
jgi:hypothetical protein